MALIALKCPHCTGDIQLDDAKEFGFCMYCGTKVMLQENIAQKIKIDQSEQLESLSNLLNGYFENADFNNASETSKRILELDPKNCMAWFVRACTTINTNERALYLNNAINYCDDEKLIKDTQDFRDNYVTVVTGSIGFLQYGFEGFLDGIRYTYSNFDYMVNYVTRGEHEFWLQKCNRRLNVTEDCMLYMIWEEGLTEIYCSNIYLVPISIPPNKTLGMQIIRPNKVTLEGNINELKELIINKRPVIILHENGKMYAEIPWGPIKITMNNGFLMKPVELFITKPGIIKLEKQVTSKKRLLSKEKEIVTFNLQFIPTV